jgi:rhamnulokinase
VRTYLAVDLGAESGRFYLGRISGGLLETEEIHRFDNVPVRLPDGLYWDTLRIFHEIGGGRRAAARQGGCESIGICTWGVDFGLLDGSGRLVANPMHYRDSRTERGMKVVAERADHEQIYAATGIQFMPINTLNQLAAMLGDPLLDAAETMLLVPDLFNYWLTGCKLSERTFASTTQMYDVTERDWAWSLIDGIGLPRRLFQELVDPGTPVGSLREEVVREAGLDASPEVVAIASHDTASAVVAVPMRDERTAFISSGTWSLVGVERPAPVIGEAARAANFTNEEGFGATTRFLRNVMGLWILQEARRTWAQRGSDHTYRQLMELARNAPGLRSFIDPDHHSFLPPGDMPERIGTFHEREGLPTPSSIGEIVRCILESLALKYRWVIEWAAKLSGAPIEHVHVVGGGARNHVLNQMVADATGLRVTAGPTEATSMGNVLVQAHASGEVTSLAEMREVARRSAHIDGYEPSPDRGAWDEAYGRFRSLL